MTAGRVQAPCPAESPGEVSRQYAARWLARDAVALAALWVADGEVITAAGAVWDGRPAIEAGFDAGFQAEFQRARLVTGKGWQRSLSPDLVLARQRFVVSGHLLPDGQDAQRYATLCGFTLLRGDAGWQIVSLQMTASYG